MTSSALWSLCDADVGTGIGDGSICLNFCQSWFYACQDDMVDPYTESSDQLPFCKQESIMCSSVKSSYASPEKFCKAFGIKIRDSDNSEVPYCYQG
jgi:hypothetical protein